MGIPIKFQDPVLNGLMSTHKHLEEKFLIFLDRNQDVHYDKPDTGFLLFLIEEQRAAIQNLEMRIARLEYQRTVYGGHRSDSIRLNAKGTEIKILEDKE